MMTAIDNKEYIVQIFTKYYPLEVELVGTQIISAIANGSKPSTPEGGESFDITPVLEAVASITTIISNMVVIYISLKDSKKEKPDINEFRDATKDIKMPQLSDIEKDELLQDLLMTIEEPKKVESQ